jgi:CRISPR/Cas system CMR subunit Cmr6 (Cas7 group RAMP superfamily)
MPIVDIFSNSSNTLKKKKKSCLSAVSEVSRFLNFTVKLVLQLVVLPNRTLRAKASLFLHGLFGFPFGAKSYTAQP